MPALDYYTHLFSHLHTNKRCGKPAPHKAVLLLSVIDLVERGLIDSPQIGLSEELINAFEDNWNNYVGSITLFSPDICKPYFHMQHESFWCLRDYGESYLAMFAEPSPVLQDTEKKNLPSGKYTVNAMRSAFSCAEIDQDLFILICNQESRAHLRNVLISNYLHKFTVDSYSFSTFATLGTLLYILAA